MEHSYPLSFAELLASEVIVPEFEGAEGSAEGMEVLNIEESGCMTDESWGVPPEAGFVGALDLDILTPGAQVNFMTLDEHSVFTELVRVETALEELMNPGADVNEADLMETDTGIGVDSLFHTAFLIEALEEDGIHLSMEAAGDCTNDDAYYANKLLLIKENGQNARRVDVGNVVPLNFATKGIGSLFHAAFMIEAMEEDEADLFLNAGGAFGKEDCKESQDVLPTIQDVEHHSVDEALLEAAETGNTLGIDYLLKSGANANSENQYGTTALIVAAKMGHEKCLRLLLASGADANYANKATNTPLIFAAKCGFENCVQELVQYSADVNTANCYGDTPLAWASRNGHQKCVELLLFAGANVNQRNTDGFTPLIWAAKYGFTKCLGLLIGAGANVNLGNDTDESALLCASIKEYYKCVNLLLYAGADVNKANRWGDTSLKVLSAALVDLNSWLKPHEVVSLKSLSREYIRNHLLLIHPKQNLLCSVPQLGLPKPLVRELLYHAPLDFL